MDDLTYHFTEKAVKQYANNGIVKANTALLGKEHLFHCSIDASQLAEITAPTHAWMD